MEELKTSKLNCLTEIGLPEESFSLLYRKLTTIPAFLLRNTFHYDKCFCLST